MDVGGWEPHLCPNRGDVDRRPTAGGRRGVLAGELQAQRSWGGLTLGIRKEYQGGPRLAWSRAEGFWRLGRGGPGDASRALGSVLIQGGVLNM